MEPITPRNPISTMQTQPHEPVSIAVLPFVNVSNDPEMEYFSDGITEEIMTVLGHIPALRVAGRTSSFAFKGNIQDIREVGGQLNVTHVLEGSVQETGKRLRITAQLTRIGDGLLVWAEDFDREEQDIFDIRDEIAGAILQKIKAQLLGDEPPVSFKRYTHHAAAYGLYLQGRFYHNKFGSADDYRKAIGFYEQAIALDPNYAIAYAGIASCYLNMWFYRLIGAVEALQKVIESTERALELDDNIAESHLAMARLQMLYQWDLIAAGASFQKALALNLRTADLHTQYALYLALNGHQDQALERTQLALSLEPFSLIDHFYAAYVYWLAADHEKAVAQGRKLNELKPSFWGGHLITGLNLITLRDYAGAQDALETAMENNYNGITLSACGALFGVSGEMESAQDILTQMLRLSKSQVVSGYDMGIVYATIGDADAALPYFEAALERKELSMLFFRFIHRDWLSGAADDPRYQSLIKRVTPQTAVFD